VLADDCQVRADMTGSWLAQMGWEIYVLEMGVPWAPPVSGGHRCLLCAAIQAYLEWEYGLVAQLTRDGTHGLFVI
jgi:hypothetical protein